MAEKTMAQEQAKQNQQSQGMREIEKGLGRPESIKQESPTGQEKVFAKSTLPARCAERIKLAQLSPDASLPIHIIGMSKTLVIGDGKRPDDEIKTMAIHPHGLYVESCCKGVTFRVIIPAVCLAYEILADGE
jgi:hypothetical protein